MKTLLSALLSSLLGLAIISDRAYAQAESPEIVHKVEATFPPELTAKGIQYGQVQLAALVTANGQVSDCLVTAATDPAFGAAAAAAIRQWRFRAGPEAGFPTVLDLEVSFGKALDSSEPEWSYRIPELKQLDRIPSPHHFVRPEFGPKAAAIPRGRITVGFFIDEHGQVRLPNVVTGVDSRLDQIALAAVSQWQFDPPLLHGQPVAVRSFQKFSFGPGDAGRAEANLVAPPRVAMYTLPGPIFAASAVADKDAIYIIGGDGNGPGRYLLPRILRFDLTTHEFKVLANNRIRQRDFGGAALVDGKIYIIGGEGQIRNTWQHTEIYDIKTDQVTDGPALPAPRAHFALGLSGRKLYLAGGSAFGPEATNEAEYLDLDRGVWHPLPPMPRPGFVKGAVPPNGRLVIAGGGYVAPNIRFRQAAVRVYVPETGKWRLRPRLVAPITVNTVECIDWRLYIFGEYRNLEIYDLASAESQLFELPLGGGYAATSVAVGHSIYLIGGTLEPKRGLSSRNIQVFQVP